MMTPKRHFEINWPLVELSIGQSQFKEFLAFDIDLSMYVLDLMESDSWFKIPNAIQGIFFSFL